MTEETAAEALVVGLLEQADYADQKSWHAHKDEEDWPRAIALALQSLRLRAFGLAVREGIIAPKERWALPEQDVFREISDALDDFLMTNFEEPAAITSRFAVATYVGHVLDEVSAVEQELAAPQRGQTPNLPRLIGSAMQMGRDGEVLKRMADGDYEQVEALVKSRGGRKPGWRKKWPTIFAPHLQAWWDKNPEALVADVSREALRFRDDDVDGYAALQPYQRPDSPGYGENGMRTAIDLMIERGQLRPPSFPK